MPPSPQPSPTRGEGAGRAAETTFLLPLREKDRMRGFKNFAASEIAGFP